MKQCRIESRLASVDCQMERRVTVVVQRIDDVRLTKVLVEGPFQERYAMVEDEPMEDVVAVTSGRRVGDRRTKFTDQNLI